MWDLCHQSKESGCVVFFQTTFLMAIWVCWASCNWANIWRMFLLVLGMGYTVVKKAFFQLYYFWDSFLYSIQPISTWNDKIFGLGSKKKVCSALLWHYTFFLWWEWIWVKNPLRTSFSGMLLWFYCLIMGKWAQNTKFWNFHVNRTLRLRKKITFWIKIQQEDAFYDLLQVLFHTLF